MSREIDIRIIREVMKLDQSDWREDAYPCIERRYQTDEGETAWHTFSPSEDASDAMEVVERMRVLGYDYEIRSDGDRVVVTFYCPPDSGGMSCGVDVDGPAKELCATIARSALRAVAGLGENKETP